MTDEVQYNLGAHGARITAIESRLERMDEKLDRVVLVTERFRGGWAALAAVGTISSGVTLAIGKIVSFLKGASP